MKHLPPTMLLLIVILIACLPLLIAGPLQKSAAGKLLKGSSGALLKDCCCDEEAPCICDTPRSAQKGIVGYADGFFGHVKSEYGPCEDYSVTTDTGQAKWDGRFTYKVSECEWRGWTPGSARFHTAPNGKLARIDFARVILTTPSPDDPAGCIWQVQVTFTEFPNQGTIVYEKVGAASENGVYTVVLTDPPSSLGLGDPACYAPPATITIGN